MKKLLLLLLLIPNLVMGESYLCVAEAAGGIRYSPQLKKYIGTSFAVQDKKIIFKKERGMALWEVSELGKKPSAQHLCKEDSSFNSIVCKGELESYGEYEFNKHWLRYKYINPSFWFDLEHSAATPNIEIGKCSAI